VRGAPARPPRTPVEPGTGRVAARPAPPDPELDARPRFARESRPPGWPTAPVGLTERAPAGFVEQLGDDHRLAPASDGARGRRSSAGRPATPAGAHSVPVPVVPAPPRSAGPSRSTSSSPGRSARRTSSRATRVSRATVTGRSVELGKAKRYVSPVPPEVLIPAAHPLRREQAQAVGRAPGGDEGPAPLRQLQPDVQGHQAHLPRRDRHVGAGVEVDPGGARGLVGGQGQGAVEPLDLHSHRSSVASARPPHASTQWW
jgi:hypothetical protein